VTAQFPRARSVVSNGSLVLMAEFSGATATTRPPWMMWLLLVIPLVAIAGVLLWKKTPTPTPTPPTPLAFPPITYAARAKPPSFSVVERGSRRGLELALSVTNDTGTQAVRHVSSTST
jgi:hypothetical protein